MPSLATRHATALLVLVLAACSSSTGSTVSTTSPPASAAPTTVAALSGSLSVFAASSLTGAFNAAKTTLQAGNPGLTITYNFAGTNTLVAQIQQGATADVFASADAKNMQKLVDAGLVQAPVTFAKNLLEIAVAPGNPKHISGWADLSRSGISLVLETVGVPAGDYARQALAAQHVNVTPKSLETDVKSALAKVTSGEADATVVYVTDVKAAGATVTGVPIPAAQNVTASYPIAVLKGAGHAAAAQAFVDSAVSGEVQTALEAAGFLPPQ
jgi:molybdate transport system substrate-binding protein